MLTAARQTGAPLTKQYEGLTEFFKLGGLAILTPVREFLKAALEDGQEHETSELASQVDGESGLAPLGVFGRRLRRSPGRS